MPFGTPADVASWPSALESLLSYPNVRRDNEQKRKNMMRSLKGKRATTGTRRRAPLACERCRSRKIKCSGENGGKPCTNCKSAGWGCTFKRMGCTEEIQINVPSAPLYPSHAPHFLQSAGTGYDPAAMLMQHPYSSMNSSMESLLLPNTRSTSPASLSCDNDFFRAPSTAPSSGLGSPKTVHSGAASDFGGFWLPGTEFQDMNGKAQSFDYMQEFDFATPPVPTAFTDSTSNLLHTQLDFNSSIDQLAWSNMCFNNVPNLSGQQQVNTAKNAGLNASQPLPSHPQRVPTMTSSSEEFNGLLGHFGPDDLSYLMQNKYAMDTLHASSPADFAAFNDLTTGPYTGGLYSHF